MIGVHYFYIYAKQRSKWNSGKLIIVTYWIKLLLVTQAQCMVYMNVLQFDVCSNCYVVVYWLPIYWAIYEMQYLCYLSGRRYNSVNSFSTSCSLVFQMPLLMPHGMCRIHACCSVVLTLHLSHRWLAFWDMTVTKMLINVERGLQFSDAVSSRLIANQRRCSIVAQGCSFDPETVGS